jgi:translation initiation factor 1 (eIF-1/SUI1)
LTTTDTSHRFLVQQQVGAKPGVMEVQVQGEHSPKVLTMLAERGIPNKCILTEDKTGGKKK